MFHILMSSRVGFAVVTPWSLLGLVVVSWSAPVLTTKLLHHRASLLSCHPSLIRSMGQRVHLWIIFVIVLYLYLVKAENMYSNLVFVFHFNSCCCLSLPTERVPQGSGEDCDGYSGCVQQEWRWYCRFTLHLLSTESCVTVARCWNCFLVFPFPSSRSVSGAAGSWRPLRLSVLSGSPGKCRGWCRRETSGSIFRASNQQHQPSAHFLLTKLQLCNFWLVDAFPVLSLVCLHLCVSLLCIPDST